MDATDAIRLFPVTPNEKTGAGDAACGQLRPILSAIKDLRILAHTSDGHIFEPPGLRSAYGIALSKRAVTLSDDAIADCFALLSTELNGTYTDDERLAYARGIAALAPRLDAEGAIEAFPQLEGTLQRNLHERSRQVIGAVDAIGVAIGIMATRLDKASARKALGRFYNALAAPPEPINSRDRYVSEVDPLLLRQHFRADYESAFLGSLRPTDDALLIELLKRPDDSIRTKSAVLAGLAQLWREPSCQGDIWKAAEVARQHGLDIESSPSRQLPLPNAF
jgi:hypothetical protein